MMNLTLFQGGKGVRASQKMSGRKGGAKPRGWDQARKGTLAPGIVKKVARPTKKAAKVARLKKK